MRFPHAIDMASHIKISNYQTSLSLFLSLKDNVIFSTIAATTIIEIGENKLEKKE